MEDAGIVSLPIRGAWIEIRKRCHGRTFPPSLPIRGAWIEICTTIYEVMQLGVAPHPGSVD